MSDTWEFDVDVSTHDLLRRGIVVADRRRVHVVANDYLEAALAACQLASSVDDAFATDVWLRI